MGGTKKTSFSVGLNWRQGFFFFPPYHQPISNPPKKHELHLVRLKPPLPLHSCFKLAVWGCDVRGMNGQNNYRYEGVFLFIVMESLIMMEAISLQGNTATITAKFKNPYRRKVCMLIRVKIYKSC